MADGHAAESHTAWVPLDASMGTLPRRRPQPPLPPAPPAPTRRKLPVVREVQRPLPLSYLPEHAATRVGGMHHNHMTESVRRLSKGRMDADAKEYAAELRRVVTERPRDLRECLSADYGAAGLPCPFVGCSRNTMLEVTGNGSIKICYARRDADGTVDVDWDRVRELGLPTCSARLDPDGMILEAIGAVMGVTRERVRQHEVAAIESIRENLTREDLEVMLDLLAALDERGDAIGAALPGMPL